MKIKEMPWFNRPGSKLKRDGVESLDDAELLAIVLWYGSRGESALELANRLLRKYNLNRLGELGVLSLRKECGNETRALKVLSLIELSKRYGKLVKGGYSRKMVNRAEDVYRMFVDELRGYKKEVLFGVLLDSKNMPMGRAKRISVGTLNASLVHPREVFKEAVKESANSIVLVHNHPSGDCSPSMEDRKVTEQLMEAGKIMGIAVLDHVIIGEGCYYSFCDRKKVVV